MSAVEAMTGCQVGTVNIHVGAACWIAGGGKREEKRRRTKLQYGHVKLPSIYPMN